MFLVELTKQWYPPLALKVFCSSMIIFCLTELMSMIPFYNSNVYFCCHIVSPCLCYSKARIDMCSRKASTVGERISKSMPRRNQESYYKLWHTMWKHVWILYKCIHRWKRVILVNKAKLSIFLLAWCMKYRVKCVLHSNVISFLCFDIASRVWLKRKRT